jgi:hypothetical protein
MTTVKMALIQSPGIKTKLEIKEVNSGILD